MRLYAPLALCAALGLTHIWRTTRGFDFGRIAAAGLVGWLIVAGVRAHPDYLAYFNELAGDHPERILVDSDLDSGQDLKRLKTWMDATGTESVHLAYFGHVFWDTEMFVLPLSGSVSRAPAKPCSNGRQRRCHRRCRARGRRPLRRRRR